MEVVEEPVAICAVVDYRMLESEIGKQNKVNVRVMMRNALERKAHGLPLTKVEWEVLEFVGPCESDPLVVGYHCDMDARHQHITARAWVT